MLRQKKFVKLVPASAATVETIQISNHLRECVYLKVYLLQPTSSVTRLGDLLDFGQLFKASGNN